MTDKRPTATCAPQSSDAKCVAAALEAAEARCRDQGIRMTPWRRKVLTILLQEHRALGAYEILDLLREGEGEMLRPPIAYRALGFLTEYGFAHKIERLSAFVACAHPERRHSPVFMICRLCQSVEEAHISPTAGELVDAAQEKGFQIERTIVEAEGVCPNCSEAAPT